MVTLTKRRVYFKRFMARPLGSFFFSCGSTCSWLKRDPISKFCPSTIHLLCSILFLHLKNENLSSSFSCSFSCSCPGGNLLNPSPIPHHPSSPSPSHLHHQRGEKRNKITHLRSRRLDLTRTGERSVNLTHGCWWWWVACRIEMGGVERFEGERRREWLLWAKRGRPPGKRDGEMGR